MEFDLQKNWTEHTYVAFDTETSGGYPLESEIIELGAVKWFNGKVIDRFQTLLKPRSLLSEENTKIHGITNEMVAEAPLMQDKILSFCEFIDKTVLIAHHAPFDLGFLTLAIERAGLNLPENIHLCTSLLSRAMLTTTNHKLQTLIKELNLEGGSAHRAYDDAYACLQVFIKSVSKINSEHCTLEKILEIQKKNITWSNYLLINSNDKKVNFFLNAIEMNKDVSFVYRGGQSLSKPRAMTPKGIVRNPDGDYIHAICHLDLKRKRFYLSKIENFLTVD